MDSANKQRISIYIDKDLVEKADLYRQESECESRNEFVAEAIRHYIAELKLSETDDIFCERLADSISKATEKQTIQISKGLFRYDVELEIIMRMMAQLTDFSPQTLRKYRAEALNNVRRTRGKIRLDHYFDRGNTESL